MKFMKISIKPAVIIMLAALTPFTTCIKGMSGIEKLEQPEFLISINTYNNKTTPGTPGTDSFQSAQTPGQKVSITIGTQIVNMIYANNQSSVTFPHGSSDASKQTLTRKMFMQETDFTNAMAVQVLQWAYNNDKFSLNSGDYNYLSSSSINYGGQSLFKLTATANITEDYNIQIAFSGGTFSVRNSEFANKPVTCITWYGAVMLCNWLTEMEEGNTANCVYSGIDNTWLADETLTDLAKTGFRLPTRIEYWYCARYRGDDYTNTVTGYSNPYFTKGNSASGATADYSNTTATSAVAVYGTSALSVIKSKTANALGLYDMTGNVWKWLENYSGNGAFDAGSCWDRPADQYLEIGVDASSNSCNDPAFHVGFRIARTQ